MIEHFVPGAWQPIASQFALDNPRCMIVADMGMRKTSIMMMMIDVLKLGGSNFFPVLVIAPKRVAEIVWTGERDKWDRFQGLSIVQILGTAKQRETALKRKPIADIYVINIDNVQWLAEILGGKWPFKIVIIDESSKLKGFRLSKGTARAGALSKIAKFTGRWVNLTGTPISNGIKDLWGQMWFVDFGERLGRTYTCFFDRYLTENPYSREITVNLGAEEEIHRLVADRVIAFRGDDWLDLQKPQVTPVEFELPPAARALYDRMETEYFMQLGGVDIEAGTAAIKSGKLLQIAAGSVYDEGKIPQHVHDGKLDALEEVAEECGEPLLVAYWWKYDVERILKRFPDARVFKGKQDEEDWNAGKLRMMLIHPQSGGHGTSLQYGGRDIAMYSYYWNAELWQQVLERNGPARQAASGFKRVQRVWILKARGTIEQEVLDSNEGKISVEQALKRARARRKNI